MCENKEFDLSQESLDALYRFSFNLYACFNLDTNTNKLSPNTIMPAEAECSQAKRILQLTGGTAWGEERLCKVGGQVYPPSVQEHFLVARFMRQVLSRAVST